MAACASEMSARGEQSRRVADVEQRHRQQRAEQLAVARQTLHGRHLVELADRIPSRSLRAGRRRRCRKRSVRRRAAPARARRASISNRPGRLSCRRSIASDAALRSAARRCAPSCRRGRSAAASSSRTPTTARPGSPEVEQRAEPMSPGASERLSGRSTAKGSDVEQRRRERDGVGEAGGLFLHHERRRSPGHEPCACASSR